jgi:hypothetical protein
MIEQTYETKIIKETEISDIGKIRRNEMKDILEEIWRNEILLNWQNYWDPINQRLR